jgi:hypothetical protein
MIDDSSASEAGQTEMREMRRGWAVPSRRGLMRAGAGLLAGASVQLLASEAAAAGVLARAGYSSNRFGTCCSA